MNVGVVEGEVVDAQDAEGEGRDEGDARADEDPEGAAVSGAPGEEITRERAEAREDRMWCVGGSHGETRLEGRRRRTSTITRGRPRDCARRPLRNAGFAHVEGVPRRACGGQQRTVSDVTAPAAVVAILDHLGSSARAPPVPPGEGNGLLRACVSQAAEGLARGD